MNWYNNSMPQVKDISEFIRTICAELSNCKGIKKASVFGSYAENINNPNHIVKDVDIIAFTDFDTGDLLAIDNSKYSALKIKKEDLMDEGFNPEAVSFTKKFLNYKEYNVDHWAISNKNEILHWGAIPDNKEEWELLHKKAEIEAYNITGCNRNDLIKASNAIKKQWRVAFDEYTKNYLNNNNSGWCLSEVSFDDIRNQIKEIK